jgi:hypothetical protein
MQAMIRIPVSSDHEIRIETVVEPAGGVILDTALWRRSGLPDGTYVRTAAGFRLAPRVADLLAEGLQRTVKRAGRQAAERALWAPAEGDAS